MYWLFSNKFKQNSLQDLHYNILNKLKQGFRQWGVPCPSVQQPIGWWCFWPDSQKKKRSSPQSHPNEGRTKAHSKAATRKRKEARRRARETTTTARSKKQKQKRKLMAARSTHWLTSFPQRSLDPRRDSLSALCRPQRHTHTVECGGGGGGGEEGREKRLNDSRRRRQRLNHSGKVTTPVAPRTAH